MTIRFRTFGLHFLPENSTLQSGYENSPHIVVSPMQAEIAGRKVIFEEGNRPPMPNDQIMSAKVGLTQTGELVLAAPDKEDERDMALVLLEVSTVEEVEISTVKSDGILNTEMVSQETHPASYCYKLLWLIKDGTTDLVLTINGKNYKVFYLGKGEVGLSNLKDITWF